MNKIDFDIQELHSMKQYPDELYYIGNKALLSKPKISIIGTRRPTSYVKQLTTTLASKLSNNGICIVSGAAMGVDAIAHSGAGAENTIAVMPNGLNHRYPKVNENIIKNIENSGLTLSQFKPDFKATPWSFVVRNELVVSLGDILIVTWADENSGSMRSIEFAQQMGKKIYVLPHRLGESIGTNNLVKNNQASCIYDIDEFVSQFTKKSLIQQDEFLLYIEQVQPSYEEAVAKYNNKVFEYELESKIILNNGILQVI